MGNKINMLFFANFYKNFFIQEEGRFSSLEGVRALAVLMVFNVHVLSIFHDQNFFTGNKWLIGFYKTLSAGHLGVDLFFILSGFLIVRTISKSENLFQFMAKRYKRLWPVVFVTTIVFVIKKPIGEIFDNLSLMMFFTKKPINFVNWSLTYEIYFYFFTAIWFFYLQKKVSFFKRYGYFIYAFLLTLFFLFLNNLTEFFFIREPFRFAGFYWGIWLALLYESPLFQGSFAKRVSKWIWVLPLFSIPILQYSWWAYEISALPSLNIVSILYYFIVQSQFFILLVALLNKDSRASHFFSMKFFRYLGTVSYSFYVIHWIWGIKFSIKLLKLVPDGQIKICLMFLSSFMLSLIFSSLLYLWLERPYFKQKTT